MSGTGRQYRVGIVGGTGYTGVELLRLLAAHPQVTVAEITSRSEAGQPVADMFPNLRGHYDLAFSEPDVERLAACDLVFFATPHNVAMRMIPQLMAAGVRVVDLSADFRLRDRAVWEHWYGETHVAPDWLEQAVYGLPEVNRAGIRTAQLVANPGCYPTAVQLGFLPLLEQGRVDAGRLLAYAASGVSGAGRQARVANLLTEAGDSFKAYGASGHRHLPEIEQGLAQLTPNPVQVTFVPHLAPMIRGMQATLVAELLDPQVSLEALQAEYEARYAAEPFVDVLPIGAHPETRSVRGANTCRIALHRPQGRRQVLVLSVIDNLVKGAAGQAIQNMNIMLGLAEDAGLTAPALLP